MSKVQEPLRQLKAILATGDLRAAVIYLNGLTPHRFTSLYRFDGDVLHNLYFFDRENPQQLSTDEIPVTASYCAFVRSTRATFAIDDSLSDQRVSGHAKQQVIQSYCGVPLLDELGTMFGTICHFDFKALPISDVNVALLESVAPLLHRSHAKGTAA